VDDDLVIIKASVFKQWWNKLRFLFESDPNDKSVGNLLRRLGDAGRASGATQYMASASEFPFDPLYAQTELNPEFDWENGEVNLTSTNVDGRQWRPNQLIDELPRVTGVRARN
jgi:hypothetical protein